jgi:integrase/recombinase XerD
VRTIRDNANKAGIRKKDGIHLRRHSYAKHLLEGRTDLGYIKELSGYNSIKATLLYTHVSKRATSRIQSSLDKLQWT